MKEKIEIRIMTADDYTAAYRLWSSMPGVGMRSLDDSEEGIAKFRNRNPYTCFVAQAQGRFAGTILCGHDGRRGYIYHAAVDPDFRKQGVGRRLVEAALEALKKEGIHKTALIVYSKNTEGIGFWRSIGFEKRADLVYMNKSLNDNNF